MQILVELDPQCLKMATLSGVEFNNDTTVETCESVNDI